MEPPRGGFILLFYKSAVHPYTMMLGSKGILPPADDSERRIRMVIRLMGIISDLGRHRFGVLYSEILCKIVNIDILLPSVRLLLRLIQLFQELLTFIVSITPTV